MTPLPKLRYWIHRASAFSTLLTSLIIVVEFALVRNPALLFSPRMQAGFGWTFAGALAAAGLCFAIVPTVSDLRAHLGQLPLAREARRAGALLTLAALLLGGALLLFFLNSLIQLGTPAVFLKQGFFLVGHYLIAVLASVLGMVALAFGLSGGTHLMRVVIALVWPPPV